MCCFTALYKGKHALKLVSNGLSCEEHKPCIFSTFSSLLELSQSVFLSSIITDTINSISQENIVQKVLNASATKLFTIFSNDNLISFIFIHSKSCTCLSLKTTVFLMCVSGNKIVEYPGLLSHSLNYSSSNIFQKPQRPSH